MKTSKNKNSFKKNLAICVGLWIAEGDSKSIREITFTNNEMELIELFHQTIIKLFCFESFRTRIYTYSKKGMANKIKINVDVVKNYIDKRANKPYYIWRLASTDLSKRWKLIVKKIKSEKERYVEILKGIFGGEGNIKTGAHNCRILRIAQLQDLFVEKILNYLNLEYSYKKSNRSYVISGKWNWDIFAENKLADLHPVKRKLFWETYNSYKQTHYKSNFLKNSIYDLLWQPHTTKWMSKKYNRSKDRISEICSQFKREKKVSNYRVYSNSYWIRNDQNKIIVSKVKSRYLEFLNNEKKRTYQIAKFFNVDNKSSYRRLRELEKLGLVRRDESKRWFKIDNNKEVIVL
ncbi:winged helix-turn-helix transcriptional regulator [archaeon]|nr:winged helix-turn-helix transcriptional regulator [archaeon]MBT4273178.1 winged helix-turn-helix transcriptional regulator [archaeon]MBT4460283.1 winged helix-turn-helix transcriptional regulator [archaeon]MBT4858412.1 winged helix-turn-helix transcriptional regulator [archaeon]MBT5423752.1 winged helix-turn-helix transcriptional regulator [archaeon]